MNAGDAFTEGRSADDWQRWIWKKSSENAATLDVIMPTYDSFRKACFYKSPDLAEGRIFLSDFFKDPVANPLGTPSGKIEIFSQTVDSFNYDDCRGHPIWLEPVEWLGAPSHSTGSNQMG